MRLMANSSVEGMLESAVLASGSRVEKQAAQRDCAQAPASNKGSRSPEPPFDETAEPMRPEPKQDRGAPELEKPDAARNGRKATIRCGDYKDEPGDDSDRESDLKTREKPPAAQGVAQVDRCSNSDQADCSDDETDNGDENRKARIHRHRRLLTERR